MSDFNCRAIGNKDAEIPGITVGDLFRIHCEKIKIEESFNLDPQAYLKVGKDKYTLKIIEEPNLIGSSNGDTNNRASTESSFDLLVTSYRVGDQNLPEVQLVTASGIHNLKGIHFKVESILNPQQPPQGPFGPAGPFDLKLPTIYWIVLASTLSLVVLISIIVGIFKFQRRRLIEKLKTKDSSLSPYHQINAKFRTNMREFAFFSSGKLTAEEGAKIIKTLDEMFKLYLTREFYIPAFDWGSRMILREFKKRHKGLSIYANNDLSLILRELVKAQSQNTILRDSDITHLMKSIRMFVDKIEDLKHKGFDKINKSQRRFQ